MHRSIKFMAAAAIMKDQNVAKLIAIHTRPSDPEAYYDYYVNVHLPLVFRLPGLRRYEVSSGPIAKDGATPSDIFLVAILHFDDTASIQNALESPEGQAAVADVPNFVKDNRMEMLTFSSDTLMDEGRMLSPANLTTLA
jgi:uncharacterized protein (TIGR02118 family)